MEIQGATALVTGASRRIGRALALALANNGCAVAIHYNTSQFGAIETKARVRECGVAGEVVQADLANSNECERLWNETLDVMGSHAQHPCEQRLVFRPHRHRRRFSRRVRSCDCRQPACPHVAGPSNEPGSWLQTASARSSTSTTVDRFTDPGSRTPSPTPLSLA